MSEKRYYWLKLYSDFFTSKRIKKLRSIAGGDTYTIIYLKMQLKALSSNGFLYFDGVMNDFAEELALDLDESVDDVKVTINFLMSVGLIESNADGDEYKLTYMDNVVGSETATAQRVRDYRANRKMLQCNADVTTVKQSGNVEIEKEIEIDKEKSKSIKRFTPPTIEEVSEYFVSLSYTDSEADRFYDYYTSNGWKVGKGKMKDWKAAARNWMRNEKSWKQPSRSKLPDFENINGYHELEKKEPQMTPEEAKEWYDNLVKELEAENGNTSK